MAMIATYDETVDLNDHEWTDINPIQNYNFSLPDSEYEQREMYTAYAQDLTPNTTYIFKFYDENWAVADSKVFLYKTLDPHNATLVVGGDIGNTKIAKEMKVKTLNKMEPDLILVAGDIAYDNAIPT